MAATVSDRVWRSIAPENVENDLATLWSEVGREAPVARALMANLVVMRHKPREERTDLTAPVQEVPVDEVARRHPSRVVVLYHSPGTLQECGPVAAAIGIMTFGRGEARYGIEEIAIRSTCAAESLPSIVRRLVLGDIPTTIWWTDDPSRVGLVEPLVAMGRQLLYDSRHWRDVRAGVRAVATILKQKHSPDIADVNWRRSLPMRQALVHALASFAPNHDLTPAKVRIYHRPGDGPLAWLTAAWLGARLGPAAMEENIAVDEERHGDDVLTVVFDDPPIAATMNDHRVVARLRSGSAAIVIAVPHESVPDAIAAELQNLRHDTCLHDAIAALART